jgi:hypothetical protein
MPDVAVEEPVESPPKTPPLLGIVSAYFVVVGVVGLGVIASLLLGGGGPDVLREPATLTSIVVTRVGLILAGLQLRKRKRAAAIAALVLFALQLLGSVLAGVVPPAIPLTSTVLGVGLIAAIWKDLRKD